MEELTSEIAQDGTFSCVTIDTKAGVPDAFTAIGIADVCGKWEKEPGKLIIGNNGKKRGNR